MKFDLGVCVGEILGLLNQGESLCCHHGVGVDEIQIHLVLVVRSSSKLRSSWRSAVWRMNARDATFRRAVPGKKRTNLWEEEYSGRINNQDQVKLVHGWDLSDANREIAQNRKETSNTGRRRTHCPNRSSMRCFQTNIFSHTNLITTTFVRSTSPTCTGALYFSFTTVHGHLEGLADTSYQCCPPSTDTWRVWRFWSTTFPAVLAH